jgi:putative (di)nucleoside polyphosphate hydrolase
MNLPYRNGVGIFLLNREKKLWIGKRIDGEKDFWQMPQGGIDVKESDSEAMMRELKEEIGTNNIKVLGKSEEKLFYDLPKELISKVWSGRYKGQAQQWYACDFIGSDNEIDLNYHKPEFSEWKWVEPEKILDLVIPFKKNMYEKILRAFKKLYY